MTESSFPFEPAEPAPFEDDVKTAGRRKPVVLVGGLVAALLVAAGGYFALGSGDAVEEDFSLPVRAPQAAPAPEAAPIEVVPAATTAVVGTNPFKARYVAPAAASAGTTVDGTPAGTATGTTSGAAEGAATAETGTTGTGGTGSTTGGTGGTTTGGTATGGTATGGTAPAPAPQPADAPKYITVVSVDAANNQVTFKSVDRAPKTPEEAEQTHVVKPGETFATYFRLFGYGTLLDGSGAPRDCTDLQYGDARLKLCAGESYQVSN